MPGPMTAKRLADLKEASMRQEACYTCNDALKELIAQVEWQKNVIDEFIYGENPDNHKPRSPKYWADCYLDRDVGVPALEDIIRWAIEEHKQEWQKEKEGLLKQCQANYAEMDRVRKVAFDQVKEMEEKLEKLE